MRLIILAILLISSQITYAQECVVLLHGYFKNNNCMYPIEKKLSEMGYKISNISYPSTEYSIDVLAKEHVAPHIKNMECDKIHFIGHSMGGILIRHYLANNLLPNLGEVIFIAVPNQGSELVSQASNSEYLSWMLLGPAVKEIGHESEFMINLPLPHYQAGVIAATKSSNPITSLFMLEGIDDGILTYESMKIPNMKDIVEIESNHNQVLYHPKLFDNIINFLKTGKFIK